VATDCAPSRPSAGGRARAPIRDGRAPRRTGGAFGREALDAETVASGFRIKRGNPGEAFRASAYRAESCYVPAREASPAAPVTKLGGSLWAV
jgi:hypothetical protein